MVTCPIHLNFLENPRLLPCGHAFCCKCLNNYMDKLRTNMDKPIATELPTSFQCPICRASCSIPPDGKADSLPNAFNHTVILEFLRKNRLGNYWTNKKQDSIEFESNKSPPLLSPVRKSSMQVSSQMLNYIVDDLSHRQNDGKINSIDRAIIIDEVNELLEKLQPKNAFSDNHKANMTNNNPIQQNASRWTGSSSPSTISPSNSIKQLGRFQAAASRVRRVTKCSITSDNKSDNPSYTLYREAESARILMKRNSHFNVLSNTRDNCCPMRPGEKFQPIDMKINLIDNGTVVQRSNFTTNPEHNELLVWNQKNCLNEPFHLGATKNKMCTNKLGGPVLVNNSNPIRIQYIRCHGSFIYLTGIVTNSTQPNLDTSQSCEFGILVCCLAQDMGISNEDTNKPNPFPVIATSNYFCRDQIGIERSDQPIVLGLDIDPETGDIYLAQPSNAIICRLKPNDLTQIDQTWYLNDPQLSPYFLCYAKLDKNIWATCPSEDKIIILDVHMDSYFHFTPSISFGIVPSHIIHTSDNRIVVLDTSQHQLYWIAKVDKAICIQRLVFQLGNSDKQRRQIMAIQPTNDDYSNEEHPIIKYHGNPNNLRLNPRSNKTNDLGVGNLNGGIMCAHDYGLSVIYPQKLFTKCQTFPNIYSCFKFC